MTLEQINLSTGPVNISMEVRNALSAPTISHRSLHFRQLLDDTLSALCNMLSVRHSFVMNGSGTLANEAMLHQIKTLGTKGLILSNGEFGSRLINQAERIGISFTTHVKEWGQRFELQELETILASGQIHWVLFCHCETSTGVLNNLDGIADLCIAYHVQCFADCMSSVGTTTLNLSKITMATASSGKGLGAYPGLALVFSNTTPLSSNSTPTYLDLANYSLKNNIPFTISSNLINALHTAIMQKHTAEHTNMIHQYSYKYYDIMHQYSIVPFSDRHSKVLTIVLPEGKKPVFTNFMDEKNIVLSYESEYLMKRNWVQLAVLGYYHEKQLDYAANTLEECMKHLF
ncbi:alanine--glyoxylate aminotransferase family protein [Chitinophaga silvatica]|uniref:Alanine--glyoxylate aminotransferase family protein n=1 Tax=Chitinophaga silvatica TaxID=2282649 RepID=A0A3E1Y907_9BACT|nr:aminotransferase class V-fold PLP-dependent enzyme [Chitinophaga silvatica]RFS21892.1 alanine--glyoxylate aminotransferase family protein [Chitinophaga silvatica]